MSLAQHLLSCQALQIDLQKPFRLTSGLYSPFYIDCRRVIGDADARRALADGMAEMIDATIGWDHLDVVAGGVTAGVPLATLLAERADKPLCYIRPEPKAHGAGRQIEGAAVEGKRVLMVEDLINRGASVQKFQVALAAAGAQFQHMAVLLSRATPDVLADLAAHGIQLHALLGLDDLLAVADLSEADRAAIALFQQNPEAWSAAHGA